MYISYYRLLKILNHFKMQNLQYELRLTQFFHSYNIVEGNPLIMDLPPRVASGLIVNGVDEELFAGEVNGAVESEDLQVLDLFHLEARK